MSSLLIVAQRALRMGGAVAQSVERATPGQEVPGSIPAVAARPTGWVGVSIM